MSNSLATSPPGTSPPSRPGLFLGQLYAQRRYEQDRPDNTLTLWQWQPGTWVEICTLPVNSLVLANSTQ
jgi:hypothetical protein